MELYKINAHSSYVNEVVFHPKDSSFFSLGFNGEIKQWTTITNTLVQAFKGHLKTVNGLILSNNGEQMVSISGDGTLKLWNISSGQLIKNVLIDPKGIKSILKISNDRFWIITASRKMKLFDLEMTLIQETKIARKNLSLLDYDPLRKWLILGGLGESILILNAEDGASLQDLELHQTAVCGLKLIGQNQFVSLGYDGALKVYDIEKQQLVAHQKLSGKQFYALAYATKRKCIAISSAYQVYLLSFPGLEMISQMTTSCKGNYGLRFSPEEELLALGSADKQVRIWKL